MEDQLAQILTNTLSRDANIRKRAEIDLMHAKNVPGFPISLVSIASNPSAEVGLRQSALNSLRIWSNNGWGVDGGIDTTVKDQIRPLLLELAINADKPLVTTAASHVVGKIASVDFPDQWPTILPTLLDTIQNGSDHQAQGALLVLRDLVDESLSDSQFFSMARDIVKVVYDTALNEKRKLSSRGIAICIFHGCLELMDTVKEEHPKDVQAFAEEAMKGWFPFFLQVIKQRLPDRGLSSEPLPDDYYGLTTMKIQVVRCLTKLKQVFVSILLPETPHFFQAIWEELSILEPAYQKTYVEDTPSTLPSAASYDISQPATLEVLIMDELDFIVVCMRAPPVKKELEAQLTANASAVHATPWLVNMMKLVTSYSCITQEDEDMWDIDVSIFLLGEASITVEYNTRTACGDILIKLGEWLGHKALEALFAYTKTLFGGDVPWRKQEAALCMFNMLISDFLETGKEVSPEISQTYLELVNYAINRPEEPHLRARGYIVASTLSQVNATVTALLDRTVQAITADESELVQVACIKAIEGFLRSEHLPKDQQLQVKIVDAISQYISTKDLADIKECHDLLMALTETLRGAIDMDKRASVYTNLAALDLLFLISKHAIEDWNITMVVCEEFEGIVKAMSDPASYQLLCQKVLPALHGMFTFGANPQDERYDGTSLIVFATELMASLTQHAPGSLPPGFVASVLPQLSLMLMESNEGEILRPSAESVKYLLSHDHEQVLNYHNENQSGLEVCLHIIDRLLGPSVEDKAASEVGGLAAELVEKAGHERLGPFLPKLLQAVANRLATAEAAQFIQSLILVFARLSLVDARDIVEFLSTIQIEGQNGLQVVLGKWLENSINFAGYDEIRQNVIALSKLYSLNDPRITQTMVKGDMIMSEDDKIMTRSRAKQNPDQYTIIPAPLKILKVLIEELLSASGSNMAASAAAAAAAAEFADDVDDDGWEDDPDTLDLGLGSNNDLMNLLEASNMRHRDDETQAYLSEFFINSARDNVAGFGEWYNGLTDDEKTKLNEIPRPE